MPNHICNVLKVNGTPLRVAQIFSDIASDDPDINEEEFPGGLGTIDFNKIIPMPKSLNIDSMIPAELYIAAYLSATASEDYADFGIESLSCDEIDKIISEWQDKYDINIAPSTFSFEKLNSVRNKKGIDLGRRYYQNYLNHGAYTWYEWCIDNWGTKWNAYDFVPTGDNSTIVFSTAWSCVDGLIAKLSKMYPDVEFEYAWADEDFGSNVGEMKICNGEIIEQNVPKSYTKESYELAARVRAESLEEYDLIYDEKVDNYVYAGN